MIKKFVFVPVYVGALVLMLMFVSGCSGDGEGGFLEGLDIPLFGDTDETMGGGTKELEVPPDLDNMKKEDTFRIPKETESMRSKAKSFVLPQNLSMRIVREGGISWLEVNVDPMTVWPEIERFWRARGFRLEESNPKLGYVMTNWRARNVRGGGQRVRGRVEDRFITRLSREPTGVTNIYIVNRQFVLSGSEDGGVLSDTDAEVAMLQALQERLSAAKWAIDAQTRRMVSRKVSMDIRDIGGTPVLEVADGYSTVWRRMIVVSQRVGFVVRNSDRARGLITFAVEQDDADTSGVFQFRLLARGKRTVITAHAPGRGGKLDYETAHALLERVLNGYFIDERHIL